MINAKYAYSKAMQYFKELVGDYNSIKFLYELLEYPR